MLVFRMFATLHVQTAFPPPCLCDLGDLCVEIPSPFLTQCYSSSRTSKQAAQNKSLQITALRALSFSVSRKSFTCHSYENCRVWLNCSHYGTQLTPATNSIPCSITPVPFLFKVLRTLYIKYRGWGRGQMNQALMRISVRHRAALPPEVEIRDDAEQDHAEGDEARENA